MLKALGELLGLVRDSLGWAREAWQRRNREHDKAVEKKDDIDERHVETEGRVERVEREKKK